MSIPRLRVIAGPNGSGKSTFYTELRQIFPGLLFLNADEIKVKLERNGYLDLEDFNLTGDLSQSWNTFILEKSSFPKQKLQAFPERIKYKQPFFILESGEINSYDCSIIATFIRRSLLNDKISFCFETVMSHPSKLDFINEANLLGYRTYLYFLCTDDPSVNQLRVKNRKKLGGHGVNPDKILSRYYRSLDNLESAMKSSYRAYLLNTSSENRDEQLFAEMDPEKKLSFLVNSYPDWFSKYLLEKSNKNDFPT